MGSSLKEWFIRLNGSDRSVSSSGRKKKVTEESNNVSDVEFSAIIRSIVVDFRNKSRPAADESLSIVQIESDKMCDSIPSIAIEGVLDEDEGTTPRYSRRTSNADILRDSGFSGLPSLVDTNVDDAGTMTHSQGTSKKLSLDENDYIDIPSTERKLKQD